MRSSLTSGMLGFLILKALFFDLVFLSPQCLENRGQRLGGGQRARLLGSLKAFALRTSKHFDNTENFPVVICYVVAEADM